MAIAPAGRGFEVLGVYGLFLALTTLTVGLRAYCRIRVQKAFGWDDWFAAIAWIFFVLHASFAITGVHHGTGQHAWDIKPASELPVGLKNWWLCEPVYVLSNMAIKASIAIMLLRLSVRPAHKTVLWITIIITELYSAFFFFLFIFQCIPSSFFWERFIPGASGGRCLDTSIIVGATYGYSAVTCVGDFVFSMLPVLLVWSLQMGRKEKGAVVLILAMGAIASIATIIRIPYIHTLADQEDFLYATTDIAIWSCSETGLGITAACCAVLRPLFREFLASSRFLSGNMSRMQTPTFSAGGVETQKSAHRRGFPGKRGSHSNGGWQAFDGSRDFDEEEVTLQSLKTHGQKPGRDGKGFGTTASVWADQMEEGELEGGGGRDGEAAGGTSPLGRDIIVTRTRDVTLS